MQTTHEGFAQVAPHAGTEARIPADVKAALSPAHIALLAQAFAPRQTDHRVNYRTSTSILGRQFYVALFIGREQRSPSRIARDGHKISAGEFLLEALFICFAITCFACLLALATGTGFYLLKSAFGIDVFDGPSFMHRLFFE